MSIEEMQKLKEEIGLKLFNKAVKGDKSGEKRKRHFPRDNKVCAGILGPNSIQSQKLARKLSPKVSQTAKLFYTQYGL